MSYSLRLRSKNFLSSVFFLVISYVLIMIMRPDIFGDSYNFSGIGLTIKISVVFDMIFWSYIVVLGLIYFLSKHPKEGKGILAFRALRKIISNPIKSFSIGIPKEEKTAVLAVIVKFFFTPLVIGWFFGNGFSFYSNTVAVVKNGDIFENFVEIFRKNLFWTIFNFILFIDVLFFSLGYLFELSFLKNKILSVEPTFLGWFVTLICYPPFNSYTNSLVGWSSSDFPFFENKAIFIAMNFLILALMGIFAWASVSLGFKASNLTHRGIVDKGPYKYIRHPAYACKSMAWWIGGIPVMIASFQSGVHVFLLALLPLLVWSCIYFLRAMTEENHLRSVNREYNEYCKKVKYRFIPGLV